MPDLDDALVISEQLTGTVSTAGQLSGIVSNSGQLVGTVSINTSHQAAIFQPKTVTPSDAQQVVNPDAGYDGLSSVTVNAIPSNYGKITYDGIKILVE